MREEGWLELLQRGAGATAPLAQPAAPCGSGTAHGRDRSALGRISLGKTLRSDYSATLQELPPAPGGSGSERSPPDTAALHQSKYNNRDCKPLAGTKSELT